MFAFNKWFLAGSIAIVGGVFSTPSYAQQHDTSSVSTTQSLVDTSVPTTVVNGSLNSDTGTFSVEGLGAGGGSQVTLSPDVIQSINTISGSSSANSSVGVSGVSNSTGVVGVDNGTGVSGGDNSTSASGVDRVNTNNSNNITICLSDPCVPAGESTKAITLNELAELMENDLQKSLNDLAAAESLDREVANRPRRLVRRRSANYCVSPSVQAREELAQKIEETRKFVEQMEKLDPNNNVW